MSERGYLLIADITGYTRFLTGSELDHAQGILASLFDVILARLKSPLVLSNIQGDAFFAFANDETVRMSGQILDSIEALYFGFRDRVDAMRDNTTCTCRACRNIGNLDLKFILHHGDYVINEIAGRHELTGSDVILLHRLLKNDVAEKTGIRAYALLTAAAVEALGLDELKQEAAAYATELSEFGTVNGAVIDLAARRQKYRAEREIVVSENEPLLFEPVSRWLPFPLDTVWQYVTDPGLRSRWQEVHGITRTAGDPQRLRPGAVEHCAHGKESIVLNYVDVKPLKHLTAETPMPFGGSFLFSLLTAPEGEGTRVTVRFTKPRCANPFAQLALRLMVGVQAKKFRAQWERELVALEKLIGESGHSRSPALRQLSASEVTAAARGLAA